MGSCLGLKREHMIKEGLLVTPDHGRRSATHQQGGLQKLSLTGRLRTWGCILWHRHALSAHTWMRTDKGPQRWWLHHLGKAESPACPCRHNRQDGHHITFACSIHETERRKLIGARTDNTWEALDQEISIKDEESSREEYFDGVEAFFSHLFAYLT